MLWREIVRSKINRSKKIFVIKFTLSVYVALQEHIWNSPQYEPKLNFCKRLLYWGFWQFGFYFIFSGNSHGEPTVETSWTCSARKFTNKLKKTKTAPTCASEKGMQKLLSEFLLMQILTNFFIVCFFQRRKPGRREPKVCHWCCCNRRWTASRFNQK